MMEDILIFSLVIHHRAAPVQRGMPLSGVERFDVPKDGTAGFLVGDKEVCLADIYPPIRHTNEGYARQKVRVEPGVAKS